jgi:hypothetical protein
LSGSLPPAPLRTLLLLLAAFSLCVPASRLFATRFERSVPPPTPSPRRLIIHTTTLASHTHVPCLSSLPSIASDSQRASMWERSVDYWSCAAARMGCWKAGEFVGSCLARGATDQRGTRWRVWIRGRGGQ